MQKQQAREQINAIIDRLTEEALNDLLLFLQTLQAEAEAAHEQAQHQCDEHCNHEHE